MTFDYSTRTRRLVDSMGQAEVGAVVLSFGPDLRYLTGYDIKPSERPTLLVVRSEGDPVLMVPMLEAPRVPDGPFHMHAWGETDDVIGELDTLLAGAGVVGIGDHTRAAVLLDIQGRDSTRKWVPASALTAQLRSHKDPAELAALADVASQADVVAESIPTRLEFEGRTEVEISRAIKEMLLEVGHDTAEFASVGSGPNGASPHHDVGGRVIRKGDLVVIDFGGSLDGYQSDTTRTFSVGPASQRQREVHELVRLAAEAGRETVRPGVACEEVDRVTRAVITDGGFGGAFIHRTGHGIGLEVHETPYIVEGNRTRLEPGMTFSIEPGIYLPGEFGVRIEDIVVCTADGHQSLNRSDRSLVEVG